MSDDPSLSMTTTFDLDEAKRICEATEPLDTYYRSCCQALEILPAAIEEIERLRKENEKLLLWASDMGGP